MTPERVLLGALTLAVLWTGYQVHLIVLDDAEDSARWTEAMAAWEAGRQ